MNILQLVLLLLGASVVVIVLCRRANLPPVLGYLLVGTVVGPNALDYIQDEQKAEHLAEFGVVFLMFSIGLEFSLAKLHAMRRTVFGLGLLQVLVTLMVVTGLGMLGGLTWQLGLALGGVLAMSSTAVLSKMLSEKGALELPHGREVMGVLLFQDLAVVPLLIIIPSLARSPKEMAIELLIAGSKAAVALVLILYLGQRIMRRWFHTVAKARSSEIFVLNVLLITLGLAYLTELAGLSLALGAFLAGMLISETEYRLQVEEDIKPFRDVLMGLFFVTIGMKLDVPDLVQNWVLVLGIVFGLLVIKAVVVGGLSKLLGSTPGNAIRSGLWLCAGGEFGFVLLGQIGHMPMRLEQSILTALVLSMFLAPLVVQYSEKIVMRFVASEWLLKSMQLTSIAAQTMGHEGHAIVCGFGRSGQYLQRMLEHEGVSHVALDMDPDRVREAAAAGESVVFGDATRQEALLAAGIERASVLIVAVSDRHAAEKILHHVQELRPDLPVVVRTPDDRDMDRLKKAGATEVVPEYLEASMMLASHALILLGVPVGRVLRRIREIRAQRYQTLRGFFRGQSDREEDETLQPRLHSIRLVDDADCVGKTLAELDLSELNCEVNAIRRRGIRAIEPAPETRLMVGDVVVLLGIPADLMTAEELLIRG
ncbi:MAG: hypothetical protein RIR18_366 [Pseudomonadota bacterium]|jgi:CPA2 family monovalent cation:H+ antiporter-2